MKRYKIRKLTPRECWRLMGFTDEDFEKAEAVNSDTQLYAQAGNSIVKPVLEAVFGMMIEPGQQEEEPKVDAMPLQEMPLEKHEPKEDEEQQEKEKEKPAVGMNINLPMRPGDTVFVPFRGIVLRCEVTYFAIYRDDWCFEVIAYDQRPLKTETADFIYLWNHEGRNFRQQDIGVKVFTNEEEARKVMAG